METHVVFEGTNGKFGIEDEHGGIYYEAEFETRREAQAIADAHNAGAETYDDALDMIRRQVQ